LAHEREGVQAAPAVAQRAGVSEPTHYRHFPTKRDLFGALADVQYRWVTEGIQPRSIDELREAVQTVFRRSAEKESVVRWTLAAPDPDRVPRPNAAARLAMLRTALADVILDLPARESEWLVRSVLLLTSPMAWLYWADYLGLDPAEAAATADWAIQRVARA